MDRLESAYEEILKAPLKGKAVYDGVMGIIQRLINDCADRLEAHQRKHGMDGDRPPFPANIMDDLAAIARVLSGLHNAGLDKHMDDDANEGAMEIVAVLEAARKEYRASVAKAEGDTAKGAEVVSWRRN